jgi:hypothetical protein
MQLHASEMPDSIIVISEQNWNEFFFVRRHRQGKIGAQRRIGSLN